MNRDEYSLQVSRVIPAPRERVFRAWIDPEKLTQWWGPENVQCVGAEVDQRVGGNYKITLKGEQGVPFSVMGSYIEISEPERLIFTWNWEDDDMALEQETQVAVHFKDLDGKTEVTIEHTKFLDEEMKNNHQGGWTNLLAKLESALSK